MKVLENITVCKCEYCEMIFLGAAECSQHEQTCHLKPQENISYSKENKHNVWEKPWSKK